MGADDTNARSMRCGRCTSVLLLPNKATLCHRPVPPLPVPSLFLLLKAQPMLCWTRVGGGSLTVTTPPTLQITLHKSRGGENAEQETLDWHWEVATMWEFENMYAPSTKPLHSRPRPLANDDSSSMCQCNNNGWRFGLLCAGASATPSALAGQPSTSPAPTASRTYAPPRLCYCRARSIPCWKVGDWWCKMGSLSLSLLISSHWPLDPCRCWGCTSWTRPSSTWPPPGWTTPHDVVLLRSFVQQSIAPEYGTAAVPAEVLSTTTARAARWALRAGATERGGQSNARKGSLKYKDNK